MTDNKRYKIIWPKRKVKVTLDNYRKISDLMRKTYARKNYGNVEDD